MNDVAAAADVPVLSGTGTALVGGHQREVTRVGFDSDGGLVSILDCKVVRHWGEDGGLARGVRGMREDDPRRFGCGWADVGGWGEVGE